MTARFSGRALDQIINSTSSAVFSIGLVAATDDATLGALAIQMTALPLLLGLARTSVFEGLLFRAQDAERPRLAWLPATTGLAGGLVALVACLIAGVLLDISTGLAVATAAAAFAVLNFDGLRFAAFALGRTRVAVVADTLWLLISLAGLAHMLIDDRFEPTRLVWWYAGAGLAGSAPFVTLLTRIPQMRIPDHVRRDFRFGLDFLLQVTAGQAALVLAALVTSLEAVGQIRAGVTIFSPLATLVYAVRLTLISGGERAMHRQARIAGLTYGTLSCGYALAIVLGFELVPQATSDLLGAMPTTLLLLIGVGELARHVSQAIIDNERAVSRFRAAVALRTSQAAGLVGFSVLLGALGDATGLGAARALAFGAPIIAAPLLQRLVAQDPALK